MSERRTEPNERSSLLQTSARPNVAVPWVKFAVLTLCRGAHPSCFAVIFPFIQPYLESLNRDGDKAVTGFAVGIVESSYSIAVLIGLFPAALASDYFGRKPTLLCALLASSICAASFGFNSTLAGVIVSRALVGFAVSFTPSTVMTMFAELSTKEHEAIAFSLNGFGWQLGSMIAPLVGAYFITPATTWPWLRGTIFDRYPYALPGVVIALVPLVGFLLTVFVLPETSASRSRKRERRISNDEDAVKQPLLTTSVRYMAAMWLLLVFVSFCNYSAEVLFFYTKTEDGGLGMTPRQMAFIFSIRPLLGATYQPIAYPFLAKRFSPESVMRVLVWLLAAGPICYYLLGIAAERGSSVKTLFAGVMFVTIIQQIGAPAFTACSQLLNSRSPSRHHLARIATLSEYMSNSGHGLGALIGSSTFALCVRQAGFGGGKTAWLFVAGFSTIVALVAQRVTHQPGWRDVEDTRADED